MRALGASAVAAGLLIACALMTMSPVQDVFAPVPLAIVALIGLSVGAFGFFYERRDPERLRLARGERQVTAQEVLPVQQALTRTSQVLWRVTLAVLVVGIGGIAIVGALLQ